MITPEAPIAPDAVDFLRSADGATFVQDTAGNTVGASGMDAIVQGIRDRFGTFRNEWFWSTTEGLPMLQRIMSRAVPIRDLESVFRRALLACPGVASVVALVLESKPENRELDVAFVVKTVSGAVLRSSDFAPFVVEY